MEKRDYFWLNIIYIVSVVVTLTVAFLILGPRPTGIDSYAIDVSKLPLINALLNYTIILLKIK